MIVDVEQRREALDPGRSFIVQSPAGSGKTGLLVQRFLRLLSVVDRPESVVAITFTRKAAAEMRERILKALKEELPPAEAFLKETFDLAQSVLQRDQQQRWNLLADPGRLQIQTIDSLSALLTRQMPVLSEFGGFGEVIEEPAELYLEAARGMLTALAEGNEADKAVFQRMVLHFDSNVLQLEKNVVTMLGKRDQWENLTPVSELQLVQDSCAILRQAEAQLRLVFQRTGKVDFTEIARAARRALGKPDQPSDLLYSLDYRFQHLLVDEFQDTSRSQFDLIKALTEQWSLGDDHTLFLVGDPMQSIYRFREADVSIFLECWHNQQLGAVQLKPLRLETNFRTTQSILDWVQSHFAPMMPDDDIARGSVQFRESRSGRTTQGVRPRLVAHLKDESGSEEAAEIIKIISANPERKVAILVRSRAQTTHILPALRKAGIAYEAQDIDSLKDQLHIIDVLSLTRALLNLADRVSWLACLRAPWCGLTLQDLSALAEGKREQTIFDLLSDPNVIATLTADGRWRAVRVQEILSEGVSKLGRMPLRTVVEQTWQYLGGLAVLSEANQREDVETLLRLIEESDQGGIIRDFGPLNRKLESLYARPPVSECNVVVMTVFNAKGLEFDTVILPRMGKMTRELDNELLMWDTVTDIVAMPQTGEKNAEHARIKKILGLKDENEIKRLFYVACTRAKNELHLIGSAGVNKDGATGKPRTGTFLRLLWASPEVQKEFDSKPRRQMIAADANGTVPQRASLLRRLPIGWQAPEMPKSVTANSPISRKVASQKQVSYRWVSDKSRHAGTLVHELFKRISADGLDKWNEERVIAMRPFVGSELLRLGVAADEKKAATERVIRAVANSIKSERGRWILSAHSEARSEWAITGLLNQRIVAGAVDRAFRGEDGTFWIIDFKNSEHTGTKLDSFLASEKERYQMQLEQYAAVISRLVAGPIGLGLYFPLHDAWLEWQFSEPAMAAR